MPSTPNPDLQRAGSGGPEKDLSPNSLVTGGWSFTRIEKVFLSAALIGLIAFGIVLETRTALRRVPMTDLGVFSCASWAAWHGENIYEITDWHGWHYQYPPALAILFVPLSHPLPQPMPASLPGESRTGANTPWGQSVPGHSSFGLHRENFRFFAISGIWYVVSMCLAFISLHALACVLEGRKMSDGLPLDRDARGRWWGLRLFALLGCIVSIGTDLSRGQVDILMLAFIAMGMYALWSRKELQGGVLIAFPATVKLFPPLLLVYPLWRRRWRAAAGVLVGLISFLLVLPGVTLGGTRTAELYKNWFNVLAKPALGTGTDQSRAKELTGMNSTDNQSLLTAVHNWHYHNMPRKERPKEAPKFERGIVYGVGVLLLGSTLGVAGRRRGDSPRDLLLLCGMLVALALILSPIVHNYYYLLTMPLLAAIADAALPYKLGQPANWRLLGVIIFFGTVDLLARMPHVGPKLRDWGVPLLALLAVFLVSAVLLAHSRPKAATP